MIMLDLPMPPARVGNPCHDVPPRGTGFQPVRAVRRTEGRRPTLAGLSPLLHRLLPLIAVLASTVGCRQAPPPDPLPTYAWTDAPTALRAMADRAKAVRTTSAECGLTLTRADGQSVEFDGAMATQPPDHLRLQAFKFGRTVFDLTLAPDGMWVKTMDDPGRADKIIPASRSAARFAREWSTFTGGLFDRPGLTVETPSAQKMVVRQTLDDGRRVVCDVDRPTLTPRRYGLLDPAGVERFSLTVADYRVIAGVALPTRLTAVGEQGTIDVRLRDPEVNVDLPPKAFAPPGGATKLAE
ncbi:MAG: hypothetical protein JWO31_2958 [Phycisphaerales bacterium]|nr:hypothetical protein [Phycisphaerales bacterium]